ncbi:S-layer homology domain-containing protein [Planococcus chinensis]|uniref:S-layer homology domain-containing protein n=1 Tax=Planococcus chinensis TaxID=272917 RepID=A0ABW4QEL4_9BACL
MNLKSFALLKKVMLVLFTAIIAFSANPKASQAATAFPDVPSSHWAHDAITDLTEKNIISGKLDGRFDPSGSVTRAQSAILIVRALGISTANRPNPGFKDVSSTTTGYKEIAALTDLGVFAKATRFNPYQPATRAQIAKILVIAFELKGTSSKIQAFKDVATANSFYSYIDTLVTNGITSGTTPSTFSPYQNVTRAQIAAFIHRILMPEKPAGEAAFMSEVLVLVNKERAKAGVPALKSHAGVQSLAIAKSKDMAANNYFDHRSPTLGMYSDQLKRAGISYSSAGENIAAGQRTPEAVMQSWMSSPGHRSNILSSGYTHIGIGTYKGGSYGYYHTQIFIKQ